MPEREQEEAGRRLPWWVVKTVEHILNGTQETKKHFENFARYDLMLG